MTDEELTTFLNITPAEAKIILPKLSPEKRALFDKMREVELWDAGFIPDLPAGVMIDSVRSKRRGNDQAMEFNQKRFDANETSGIETRTSNVGKPSRKGSDHA